MSIFYRKTSESAKADVNCDEQSVCQNGEQEKEKTSVEASEKCCEKTEENESQSNTLMDKEKHKLYSFIFKYGLISWSQIEKWFSSQLTEILQSEAFLQERFPFSQPLLIKLVASEFVD